MQQLVAKGTLKADKVQAFSLQHADDLLAGCSTEDQAEMKEVVMGHLLALDGNEFLHRAKHSLKLLPMRGVGAGTVCP